MARVKGGLGAKKRHNRTLKLAKGYRGARSKQYRVAKQSVMRALTSSYAGRKERKRQFRQLWIARINAAARMNGISYSQMMHGLKVSGIDINRKMLAEMAVNDAAGFANKILLFIAILPHTITALSVLLFILQVLPG
jgi:large subunit ribosomal protein L20